MLLNTYRLLLIQSLAQTEPGGAELKDSELLKAYATYSLIMEYGPEDMASAYNQIVSDAKKNKVMAQVILKKLVPDNEILQQPFDKFTGISLVEFLRFVVPDLVCNVEDSIRIIDKYTTITYIKVFQILSVKWVAYDAQNAPRPQKSELKDQLWKSYCSRVSGMNVKLIAQEDFIELYQSINYYPLDVKELSDSTPMKAVTAWSTLGESTDHQLEYASEFYTKHVQAPVLEALYSDAQDDIERKNRTKVFRYALEKIAKTSPIDFLCAAKFDRNNNDIALENGLIYSKFTSTLHSELTDLNVLIYNPTPFFIRKWVSDSAMRKIKTTFLVDDASSRDLLAYNYQIKDYGMSDATDITFEIKDKWEKKIQYSGRLDCNRVLFFATRNSFAQQEKSIKIWKQYAQTMEFNLFVATSQLENSVSSLSKELYDNRVKIDSIILLPQGINNSTVPRRKLFIRCILNELHDSVRSENDENDENDENNEATGNYVTKLYSFPLNLDWSKQLLSLQIRPPVQVKKNELQALDKSIRDLYRNELLKRKSTGKTKGEPISYEFTPEITIWFSKSYPKHNWDRPRLEAYICYPPDPKKIKRGYLERGAQIDTTVKHKTNLMENEIFDWLEYEYPFDKVSKRRVRSDSDNATFSEECLKPKQSIREKIIAAYEPIYQEKPLSIKLLWYLYPDLQDIYSERDYSLFVDMVHTKLGALRLVPETSEQVFLDCMAKEYPDASQKNTRLITT